MTARPRIPDSRESFQAFALTLAAFSLAQAIQVANGTLRTSAVVWLSVAIAACLAGVLVRGGARLNRLSRIGLPGLIAVALIVQFVQLLSGPPASFARWDIPEARRPFLTAVGAAAVCSLPALCAPRRWRRLAFGLVLAAYVSAALFILRQSPLPYIDVVLFHREGSHALLNGQNPYAARMFDIYAGRYSYYTSAQTRDGWLTFGFIYPPLSLLLALPGYLLGDFRWSQLAAVAGSALLMARRGRLGISAALLFLTIPRGFYVLEMGWTEPFAVLLLCVVVSAARDRRLWLRAGALGLFVSVKQHLVLFAPLALILLPRPWFRIPLLRVAAVAGFVAAATMLPFYVWDPSAFIGSLVTTQLNNPFRADALSYAAWLVGRGFPQPSSALVFVLLGLGIALCLWRAPRTSAGFAASCALALLFFFAFAKQAFCNYYFFVLGALCCALASSRASTADCDGRKGPAPENAPESLLQNGGANG